MFPSCITNVIPRNPIFMDGLLRFKNDSAVRRRRRILDSFTQIRAKHRYVSCLCAEFQFQYIFSRLSLSIQRALSTAVGPVQERKCNLGRQQL